MCMESKDPDMGLPTGVVTSTGTSTTAPPTHNGNIGMTLPTPNGNSEAAMVRPVDATTTRPPHSADMGPSSHGGAPLPTSAAPSSSHLNSAPSVYMPTAMSTAIVPISTGGFSFINSCAPSGLESIRKKRGRPRKYGPEGSLALTVTPLSAFSPSPSSPSQKRGRGRPPGSGKNQQLAALGELMLGSIGAGFTPHAITVATGEDIASRIMSFSQQGPRGICILSANGAISSVTLRQPSISGGIVTYEGRFEILSLSGSFLLTELGGARSRTGGLSVSLAGPDGRVVGGSVAGVLIAASPVQVVVGSFLCNSKKLLSKPPKTDGSAGLTRQIGLNATKANPSTIAGHPGPSPSIPESESKPMIVDQTPALNKSKAMIVDQSPALNKSSTTSGGAGSNATSPNTRDEEMRPVQQPVCPQQAATEEKHTTASNNPLPK